jgi:RNA polymerase sigma factor (sigma-70 family)
MIRVLLVDDHASLRESLAFLMGREPDLAVAGEAGTLAEARALMGECDVALIDLDLPDGDGIALIAELSAANPRGATLVLTADTDRRHHAAAVEAGAAGVMHKSAGTREIIDAVRRLGAGELLLSAPETLELLRLAARHRSEEQAVQAAVARLTPREREVLQALAEGLGDKEIAQRLGVTHETARTHASNILAKLAAQSRLQAVLLAIRLGLVTPR